MIRRSSPLASPWEGRDHRFDAEDIECSTEIVGERREAELGADIVEALHQKRAP